MPTPCPQTLAPTYMPNMHSDFQTIHAEAPTGIKLAAGRAQLL